MPTSRLRLPFSNNNIPAVIETASIAKIFRNIFSSKLYCLYHEIIATCIFTEKCQQPTVHHLKETKNEEYGERVISNI